MSRLFRGMREGAGVRASPPAGAEARSSSGTRPTPSGLSAAVLGLAVLGGWVLHDLAVYLNSGRPALVLDLLPSSTWVVLAGAPAGWAVARWRRLAALVILMTATAALLLTILDLPLGPRPMRLSFAVLILSIALALVVGSAARRPGRLRLAISLGIFGCALATRLQALEGLGVALLSTVLACLAIGWLPRPWLRGSLTMLIVIATTGVMGMDAYPDTRPSRPDLAAPTSGHEPDTPNLLLIVLDTVRADHLAPYGYRHVTTPGLDALVREHFSVFTQARATSSWTLPSHASLFTGLYPAEHGSVHAGRFGQAMRGDAPTLAELLRGRGFRTAAVMSNNIYLRAGRYGLARGFEHYDDRLAGKVGRYMPLVQLAGGNERPGHLGYRDARTITDLALQWLDRERAGAPFFLMLNYMDAHTPHIPVADARAVRAALGAGRTPGSQDLALPYDMDLFYLDEHVSRLLHELMNRGLFASTAVIITSDHGESLGDHGYPAHGWVLYESVLRVPLYVKPAGVRGAPVVERPVTGADVFHMALARVGLESPADGPRLRFPGLVGELHVHPEEGARQEPRDRDRDSSDLLTWLEGAHKFIVSTSGRVEVFDLDTDPDELRPLPLSAERLREIRAKAETWWRAHPPPSALPIEFDDDTLDRMRALGY